MSANAKEAAAQKPPPALGSLAQIPLQPSNTEPEYRVFSQAFFDPPASEAVPESSKELKWPCPQCHQLSPCSDLSQFACIHCGCSVDLMAHFLQVGQEEKTLPMGETHSNGLRPCWSWVREGSSWLRQYWPVPAGLLVSGVVGLICALFVEADPGVSLWRRLGGGFVNGIMWVILVLTVAYQVLTGLAVLVEGLGVVKQRNAKGVIALMSFVAALLAALVGLVLMFIPSLTWTHVLIAFAVAGGLLGLGALFTFLWYASCEACGSVRTELVTGHPKLDGRIAYGLSVTHRRCKSCGHTQL